MQSNIFHIHTHICKHSSNDIKQIISYAIKHNYKKLYFTEHAPISVKCYYQTRRPSYKEIAKLKKTIDLYNKQYINKIRIYFGYEVEYNQANRWYIKKISRDKYCEFLIFGNHFYGDIFKIQSPLPLVMNVTKTVDQLMEFNNNNEAAFASGLMSWIAHPDIYLNSYKKWDKAAISVAKNTIRLCQKYKLTLGFDVNFPSWKTKSKWHYPCKYFWKLVAKTNIPVIIESDAHDIKSIRLSWLLKARKLAISWGLKKNLTQNVKLVKLIKK